ncbi:hypothetical protein BDW22DRAFT_1411123, partial [Trametopsis cervina]
MRVWVTTFDVNRVDELKQLYEQALPILDADARTQVERYYHFVDSFRGLVGRLLIRKLLKDHGVPLHAMTFATTSARKPYITTAALPTPIGYNITHDNGVVAMAYATGPELSPHPPTYRVGLDVMLLQLPRRVGYAAFVESVSDQLTERERQLLQLSADVGLEESLRKFYLIWTLKEAYTKALGLGLGFDFSRIEYDVPRDVVRIDGVAPEGWTFVRFDLQRAEDAYVGVVAQYIGDKAVPSAAGTVEHREAGEWIEVHD